LPPRFVARGRAILISVRVGATSRLVPLLRPGTVRGIEGLHTALAIEPSWLTRPWKEGLLNPGLLNQHHDTAYIEQLLSLALIRFRRPVEGLLNSGLPPGTHERDGYWMSFWTHVPPDPERTPTTDDCSAMLVDLYTTLRAYPGKLPMLCAGRYALRLRPKMRQCVRQDGADSDSRRGTPPRSGVPRPAREPGWHQSGTRGRPCPATRPARSADAAE
jgi:hypothetical protein